MDRRCFDHFFVELSVAIGKLVPRYALWLDVQERGSDPVSWDPADMLAYYDHALPPFLDKHALVLPERPARRLRRALARFDPAVATPYETMERIFTRMR